MSVSRIHRLLRLITMLQSGRCYSVSQLVRELEVSRRTIFRDLNMLELAHIPYYYDRQGRTYRINQHFFLPPVNLTLPEALALMVSAGKVQASGVEPLAAASGRAALKLESVLPAPVRQHVGSVMDHLAFLPAAPARSQGLEDLFDRLASAVVARKVCRLVYISFLERKQLTFVVEPLRLVFVGRAWYLLGYSRQHRRRLTFKLGRIRKLTLTDETFRPRRRLEADPVFGQAWSMIPEGKLYGVHLRFLPKVAGNVGEVNWHHSQKARWNDDGSLDLRLRVDGLGEITWWVLSYGDQVRVLAPRELARRVWSAASRAAAQYSGGKA
jgi:predicted DNA-binding transcriptional regulator YafY